MDIVETGHDRGAMEIDDSGRRADILPDEGGVAGRDDEGACDGYGLCAGAGGLEGDEVAVGEDEVGGLGEGSRLNGGLGSGFWATGAGRVKESKMRRGRRNRMRYVCA
jgi:hypothetical protein